MSDNILSLKVAARFAARPMDEGKMEALLLKLRKGADSSVSLKQLIEALTYLGGWKVEPFIGLVQMHGYGTKKGDPNEDKSNFEVDESADHVQLLWERVKADEVKSFPSNPKHGQRYTMDVTDPTVWPAGGVFKNDRTGFYFKEWRGRTAYTSHRPKGRSLSFSQASSTCLATATRTQ